MTALGAALPPALQPRLATRLRAAAGVAGVLGAAAIAAWLAGRDPVEAPVGGQPAAVGLILVSALALALAGGALWVRRRTVAGSLLLLAAVCWCAAGWAVPSAPALLFTAGLVLGPLWPALLAHAAVRLAHPSGLPRMDAAAVGALYTGGAALGLVSSSAFDPASEGCFDCSGNLALVHASASLWSGAARVGLWVSIAAVGALLVVGAGSAARLRPAARREVLPVLLVAGAVLVLVAAQDAHALSRGVVARDALDQTLARAQAIGLVLVAASVGLAWLRILRARSTLAGLVVELERTPAAPSLGVLIGELLDDASVQVLYTLPDGNRVLADGSPARPAPGQAVTPLVVGGRLLAELAHDGLADRDLVPAIAAAAALALERERLEAELAVRLDDLRAARRRIVAAADAERRGLERDLHDGAQQRLVTLALSLQLAHATTGSEAAARHAAAKREVGSALDELREVAHGLVPAILADEGFAAAVEALAESGPVPLALPEPLPRDRLALPVEAAAYHCVAETLRRARPRRASVRARLHDGRLITTVALQGPAPSDIVDLADRVGALGGDLRTETKPDGTSRLHMELPCG